MKNSSPHASVTAKNNMRKILTVIKEAVIYAWIVLLSLLSALWLLIKGKRIE